MRYMPTRKKSKWKWGLLSFILIGLLYSLFSFSLILSCKDETAPNNADTVIILGAKVKGKPAKPSSVLQERLDTAIQYLQDNPKATVIVSGGKGSDENESEVRVMARYLVNHGIPSKKIIAEDDSTNTMENLMNASHKTKLGKTVVVSNDFHIYRAKLLAKRLGIKNSHGLAAPTPPSAKTISYAREILALGYAIPFEW